MSIQYLFVLCFINSALVLKIDFPPFDIDKNLDILSGAFRTNYCGFIDLIDISLRIDFSLSPFTSVCVSRTVWLWKTSPSPFVQPYILCFHCSPFFIRVQWLHSTISSITYFLFVILSLFDKVLIKPISQTQRPQNG
mgnify:CR=1 FL=1